MAGQKAPWCAAASWLGLLVGWGVGWLVAAVSGDRGDALAMGSLAAAVVGLGLAVAARARDEGYPWLGSAVPY